MRHALIGTVLLAACLAAPALAGEVPGSAQDVRPLLIGSKAPDLTVKNGDGEPFDLSKAFESKRTVLILYRGGW
jgi:hypothetical protein